MTPLTAEPVFLPASGQAGLMALIEYNFKY
jgi:hypothetical protein